MDQASTGVRWVYSIQCRWDINYPRQLCDSTSSEFKQAKSWLLILHNFEFNGQKAETVPSYQTIITLIRQLMNSHIVWKLSPSLSCLCWYYFHFHSYLFLKIGCRQCKVVRVLKQTTKALFSLLKEKSGRRRSLLLESSTRVKNHGSSFDRKLESDHIKWKETHMRTDNKKTM